MIRLRCSRESAGHSHPLRHFLSIFKRRYNGAIASKDSVILVLEGCSDIDAQQLMVVEGVVEHAVASGPLVCLVPIIKKADAPAFIDGFLELGALDDAQRLDFFSRKLPSCAARTAADLTEGMLVCDLAGVYRFACLKAIDRGAPSPVCADVVRAVAQLQRKPSDVPPVLAGRPCVCSGSPSSGEHTSSSPLEAFFGSQTQVKLLEREIVAKFGPGLPRGFYSVLITGMSGCGKTYLSNLLARAISARSVLRLKASDILSSLVGASEAKLAKSLLDIRKEPGPFAVIIDDVESIAPADASSVSGTVQRLLVTLIQYGIDDAGWGVLLTTALDAGAVHPRLREKSLEVQLEPTLDPLSAEKLYKKCAPGLPVPESGIGFTSPAEIVCKAREAACDSVPALPRESVDMPIKQAEDRSLAEFVFDGHKVYVLPDTGGAKTYALDEKSFGEATCRTYATGCYPCPEERCAEIRKTNLTARFLDGTTFTYFRYTTNLNVKLGSGTEVDVIYNLGLVKDYSPKTFHPHPIVGLRREPSFSSGRYSFIHQLVRGSSGAIRKMVFSLAYPRTTTDVGHFTAGGDPDPDWHAPFMNLQQRDEEAWTLKIEEAGYRSGKESEAAHIKESRVLFDSGAGIIIGPKSEVRTLWDFIGKFVKFTGGVILKTIDCSDVSKLPDIWFDIKADDDVGLTTRLFVEGRDYSAPSTVSEECTIDIVGIDIGHLLPYGWIVGAPLFKGHFVQFSYDSETIGFAKKKI
ncbi:hypothetical protein FOL47_010883 [Perkinsus chesapeaki]|uniref:Peptidase A1 domain-containing protein n=1 Tax=Perkinsus chesapeaki TaxID=330153 RepID=A0A7J6MNU2_PERCH|nr:hypothetical protein FOL47_010883 [Perkinsus chesapeaki]